MQQKQQTPLAASTILARIKTEYEYSLSSDPISLQELFEPENFRFGDFCKEFNPHPESKKLRSLIQDYGETNGIWLANASHHVTCALYLYPNAGFERMLTMMRNLTLGFYLNDVMGRDTFKFLPPSGQRTSRELIENMAALNGDLSVRQNADPLELVNAEILQEFKNTSTAGWFDRFLKIYNYHIGITHTDGGTESLGKIPGIFDYMELRCHLGGVHHILLWIEYSDGQFLDWDVLRSAGIAQDLERLHWVAAAFAGLSNDHFSFEKEVIDSDSDSNLLMIVALNHPNLSLQEVILKSSELVRNLLRELLTLLKDIKTAIDSVKIKDPELGAILSNHLLAIERCVQATWLWQCYSKRYKRPVSIWKETILAD